MGEMMVLTMCAVEQGVVLGVSEHRPNDGTPRVIPNRGPESSGLARGERCKGRSAEYSRLGSGPWPEFPCSAARWFRNPM